MVAALLVISGCTAGIKGRADQPDYIAASPSNSVYVDEIRHAMNVAQSAEDAYCIAIQIACPSETSAITTELEAPIVPAGNTRLYRDTYAYEMMRAYDLALQDYGRSLSIEGRGGSFAQHLLNLGLITAAGISKVQESARILNLLAASVLGIGEGYSETVLVKQTIPALLNKMRTAQSAKRVQIIGRLKSQDVANYSLSAVRLDLSELGGVSTIDTAVTQLNKDAEDGLQEQKKTEELTKTIQRCDGDDTARMAAWFFVGDKDLQATRLADLRTFLADKKQSEVDPVELIYGCSLAGLRKSFIKEKLDGGA